MSSPASLVPALAAAVAGGPAVPVVDVVDAATSPLVVDGVVTRVIEIEPYPVAPTPLGGCTGFDGRYVTDPAEVAAIARRVRGGKSW